MDSKAHPHTTTTINGGDAKYYTMELHMIKVLFLHGQYRRCIELCRSIQSSTEEILKHRYQKAFVHFYLGLAHDELARVMHVHSQAKLQAFEKAAQSYRDALHHLSVDAESDLYGAMEPAGREDLENTAAGAEAEALHFDTPNPINHNNGILLPQRSSRAQLRHSHSAPETHPISSPSERCLPARSPNSSSSAAGSPRVKDIEDYDELSRTSTSRGSPRPALQRDFSRMLLFDRPARPSKRLPRATTQGLLKPIRLGSPPKPYFAPTSPLYTNETSSTSRLPRLAPREITPIKYRPKRYQGEDMKSAATSPTSSPSPNGKLNDSDASTASPVTPKTPSISSVSRQRLLPQPLNITKLTPVQQPRFTSTIADHATQPEMLERQVAAMRAQIETHINLVEQARSQALAIQAERAAARAGNSVAAARPLPRSPVGEPGTGEPSNGDGGSHGSYFPPSGLHHSNAQQSERLMPSSRSFWSFTPPDQKVEERQRRIRDGRARGWERKRFDRSRYCDLAERALAEL